MVSFINTDLLFYYVNKPLKTIYLYIYISTLVSEVSGE